MGQFGSKGGLKRLAPLKSTAGSSNGLGNLTFNQDNIGSNPFPATKKTGVPESTPVVNRQRD